MLLQIELQNCVCLQIDLHTYFLFLQIGLHFGGFDTGEFCESICNSGALFCCLHFRLQNLLARGVLFNSTAKTGIITIIIERPCDVVCVQRATFVRRFMRASVHDVGHGFQCAVSVLELATSSTVCLDGHGHAVVRRFTFFFG